MTEQGPGAAEAAQSPARVDAERLREGLGAEAWRIVEAFGQVLVDVEPAAVPAALAAAEAAGYDFLCDIAATDYLDYAGEGVGGYWGGPSQLSDRDINAYGVGGLAVVPRAPGPKRFAVTYTLLARGPRPPRRLRVRTWVDDGEPIASAVPVFPGADYQEREAFDLMGLRFDGHPNLQRIFLPEDWDGHPHRKDYPIGGEPVQFSEAT